MNVRYWHLAGIHKPPINVRFWYLADIATKWNRLSWLADRYDYTAPRTLVNNGVR
jgi:hypothetical protein